MARNIEIKARARAFDRLREQAATLATEAPLFYRQQDFFYDVPRGRLKLRRFEDGTPAELIFYQRDDRDGPKASYYTRSPVTNPDAMHALLATALTTRGIVTKERHAIWRAARVFTSIASTASATSSNSKWCSPDDDEADGEAEAHRVFAQLGVAQEDLVAVAYVDLLNADAQSEAA
jgi:adenylate cyclase class IV